MRIGQLIQRALSRRLNSVPSAAALVFSLLCGGSAAIAAAPTAEVGLEDLRPTAPREPVEALSSLETLAGYRVELVAHEPLVTDPVAAAFDEDGRLYVAEMRDYPYPPGEGLAPLGRVRLLEDRDNDGFFETSSIFAGELLWPTGIACWLGGVFVSAAPDIWYLKDTDGDGKADIRQRVFTGFGVQNEQGTVNNLAWGIDQRIYGSASQNGGTIKTLDGSSTALELKGSDFCFDPRTRRIELVSGHAQFGNTFDDWGNRFLCSESKAAYHVVLPLSAVERNPYVARPTLLEDLAPGVTPVFRCSPIEPWRAIRTQRRLDAGERPETSAGASHGVLDAGAGLTIYRGDAYPPEVRGQAFIACAQNNLIHRRRLDSAGVTFRSSRVDEDTEFLRSDDTWFRPVNLVNAPDGTLCVLDMAREVIEAIHIPLDVVARLDLTSGRQRGRIYRVVPVGFQRPKAPRLSGAQTAELVAALERESGWWRDTAQRLLVERQDRGAIPGLRRLLRQSASTTARLHALWTLAALAALDEPNLLAALGDEHPEVREHALRFAGGGRNGDRAVASRAMELAEDTSARVRYQAAMAIGRLADSVASDVATGALAAIARRDCGDRWIRAAVVSSASGSLAGGLLQSMLERPDFLASDGSSVLIAELALTAAACSTEPTRRQSLLDWMSKSLDGLPWSARVSLVDGLATGFGRQGAMLDELVSARPRAAAVTNAFFSAAASRVVDAAADLATRAAAASVLRHAPPGSFEALLTDVINGSQPDLLALAALEALAARGAADFSKSTLDRWAAASPPVQQRMIDLFLSRGTWRLALLEAIRDGRVAAAQVTTAQRNRLSDDQDPEIAALARSLFLVQTQARSAVIEVYREALHLSGDAAAGKRVFERECSACHRLGAAGYDVGPNLALVRDSSREALLVHILDPNREVQPAYVQYSLVDDRGRAATGIMLAGTLQSVTLGRERGLSETFPRESIVEVASSGRSLMPEGFERTIDVAGMADLLAFLESASYDVGTVPRQAPVETAPPRGDRVAFIDHISAPDDRRAIEPAALAAGLTIDVLDDRRPLDEIREYALARIPRLPKFSSLHEWRSYAERIRRRMFERVIFRGSAAAWRQAATRVEWLGPLEKRQGYSIEKLRYEVLPGMWVPGLLYVPRPLEGKVPVVLNVNGHDPQGKSASYKQIRCINLARRGMLALNVEWFGMGQLAVPGFAHERLNQLDLCGGSGLAPFYLALSRALDLLLDHPHADSRRVAVTGLSGGGWQTILLAALDPRVTVANPVAGYGDLRTNLLNDDLGDSEQAPSDLVLAGEYLQLTALRAPRPTLLTYNAADDCCFRASHSLRPLVEGAGPVFGLYGARANLGEHVNTNPGTHNFDRDNREALYRFLQLHFAPEADEQRWREDDCQYEVKSADELQVPLPDDNLDLHGLAMRLADRLPQPPGPLDGAALAVWQDARRGRLRELLRVPDLEVLHTSTVQSREEASFVCRAQRLAVGTEWTLPLLEWTSRGAAPHQTDLLVSERTRELLADEIAKRLHRGRRVVVLEPLLWGESTIADSDPVYLFALALASVGERPLGIQAAQIAAVARWLRAMYGGEAVGLVGVGPRSATAALVAAALEPGAIGRLELFDGLGSFRDLLAIDRPLSEAPELYAFGLLEYGDVVDIARLVVPRPVTFCAPDTQLGDRLDSLRDAYRLAGSDWDPLP